MNLTKLQKDELAYPIVNVYLDLETEILKNIARFLAKGTTYRDWETDRKSVV